METTALFENDGTLFVLCPHCASIHTHDSATTARLIAVPAACSTGDDGRMCIIGATVKPKSLLAAIHLHQYESRRKQDQYRRRKDKTAIEGGSASD